MNSPTLEEEEEEEEEEDETENHWPIVVLPPEICCTLESLESCFVSPEKVSIIGNHSSLVVRGPGRVTIESLQLDGALEIVTKSREECITIRNCVVKNAGKRVVRVPHSDDEVIAMRGFFIETIEVNVFTAEA